MTVIQLKQLAKQRGIKLSSGLTKQGILNTLGVSPTKKVAVRASPTKKVKSSVSKVKAVERCIDLQKFSYVIINTNYTDRLMQKTDTWDEEELFQDVVCLFIKGNKNFMKLNDSDDYNELVTLSKPGSITFVCNSMQEAFDCVRDLKNINYCHIHDIADLHSKFLSTGKVVMIMDVDSSS